MAVCCNDETLLVEQSNAEFVHIFKARPSAVAIHPNQSLLVRRQDASDSCGASL